MESNENCCFIEKDFLKMNLIEDLQVVETD